MNKIRPCSGLTFVLVLAIRSPIQAQTLEPAQGKTMKNAAMMEHCQEMKEHKQKMADDTKAQDAQLTQQLAET